MELLTRVTDLPLWLWFGGVALFFLVWAIKDCEAELRRINESLRDIRRELDGSTQERHVQDMLALLHADRLWSDPDSAPVRASASSSQPVRASPPARS